ncbi:hypothetical protein F7725_028684 [Dissostichus mawsoni]|uniref:Uncharacterized protein n=1 Tax=Dissostichus mawsoni TaxID=36200 RepID=A0A7J5XGC3_DISMA|nr:hypothetical protein F7725_028684 [Dissostichus mawsoni]
MLKTYLSAKTFEKKDFVDEQSREHITYNEEDLSKHHAEVDVRAAPSPAKQGKPDQQAAPGAKAATLSSLSGNTAHSGEQYLPAKRTLMEGLCRMKKRKGWSATKRSGRIGAHRSIMIAAVAAAASVPSSLTSTKALWTTFDRTRSFPGDMPVTDQNETKYFKQICLVSYDGNLSV